MANSCPSLWSECCCTSFDRPTRHSSHGTIPGSASKTTPSRNALHFTRKAGNLCHISFVVTRGSSEDKFGANNDTQFDTILTFMTGWTKGLRNNFINEDQFTCYEESTLTGKNFCSFFFFSSDKITQMKDEGCWFIMGTLRLSLSPLHSFWQFFTASIFISKIAHNLKSPWPFPKALVFSVFKCLCLDFEVVWWKGLVKIQRFQNSLCRIQ